MNNALKFIKQTITHNFSYKLVALLISLILWVAITGRKDAVVTRDLQLEFLAPKEHIVLNGDSPKVSVKVVGPRDSLKKFNQMYSSITVDLTKKLPGMYPVLTQNLNYHFPLGVKLIKTTPEKIVVELKKKNQGNEDDNKNEDNTRND